MRIVVNALSARRGGGITYLLNFFYGLGETSDNEFIILTSGPLAFSGRKNVSHLRVRWPTTSPILRGIWERIVLPNYLRRIEADILFCPGGLITHKTPPGCKTVTMFRNMIPFDPVQRRKYGYGLQRLRNVLLNYLMRNSMTRADLVIFISNYASELIQQKLNGKLKQTVVIPHGLHKRFKTAGLTDIQRSDWLPTDDYFLYVSIFDVYKNQLEVVRGFHMLKQFRQTSEKLILVGEHHNRYGQRVKDEICNLGLQDDILLPGAIPYEELPNVYHHAKINIFASECENCPNILIEALGAGKPMLVSNRQPMLEFGRDAVVYFDPTSPDDIAEKMISVIDDQLILDELSKKARELSHSYDWCITAGLTIRAFNQLFREQPS